MAKAIEVMPFLDYEEMMFVQQLLDDLTDEQAKEFAMIYTSKRKDPTTVLILTLVGFLGIGGIQRFFLDSIGMGILYLLTGGLCYIGTIIDLVNYKSMTNDYNRKAAHEIRMMMKSYR